MNRRLASTVFAVGCAACALSVATDSSAGQQVQSVECGAFSGGGGFCEGTMLGFRNSPTPSDFAAFGYSGASSNWFEASAGGNFYSCMTSSAYPAVGNEWPVVMNFRGFFFIEWNASGQCSILELTNASEYSDF